MDSKTNCDDVKCAIEEYYKYGVPFKRFRKYYDVSFGQQYLVKERLPTNAEQKTHGIECDNEKINYIEVYFELIESKVSLGKGYQELHNKGD